MCLRDDVAAHVCAPPAARPRSLLRPGFFFSRLAFPFARRRLSSDAVWLLRPSLTSLPAAPESTWETRVHGQAVRGRQGQIRRATKDFRSCNNFFFSLIVTLDEKWCNWSPAALFCRLSRCFHGPEKGMQNMSARVSVSERTLFLVSADRCFLLLGFFLQGIAPPL